MNITIKEVSISSFYTTVKMITELMNFHRDLHNAPKEYWQNDEQSEELLHEWILDGEVYNIILDNKPVGFFYIKLGGQNVAWLEDLFITEEYRGDGLGKKALEKLDEIMIQKNVISMFVDVVPRNTRALQLYSDCGFDHLNLIQLRKNYTDILNKEDEVEVLGINFKKY